MQLNSKKNKKIEGFENIGNTILILIIIFNLLFLTWGLYSAFKKYGFLGILSFMMVCMTALMTAPIIIPMIVPPKDLYSFSLIFR